VTDSFVWCEKVTVGLVKTSNGKKLSHPQRMRLPKGEPVYLSSKEWTDLMYSPTESTDFIVLLNVFLIEVSLKLSFGGENFL